MEENEYIKEILTTKLDSQTEIIRMEIKGLKDDISQLETNLETHISCSDTDRDEYRQSIIRVHARMDILETALHRLESTPAKKSWKEWLIAELWKWAVPVAIVFIIWLFTSGSLLSFLGLLVPKAGTN